MREIELSTMLPGSLLNLKGFEERSLVQTTHRQLDWETGWNQILQIGLYQKGPDVSEVGSTWMENLSDMRALRPFSPAEVHALGGESAFLGTAWQPEDSTTAGDNGPRRIYSIPWQMDTRLVFFRRDLLAKAGVPEKGAFATPEAMYDTLCRLQVSGIRYPLGLSTGGLSIHNLACWVWGRGGHFRSPDYRKVALVEPEARRGMVDFFRLHRFIDPASRGEGYTATNTRFYHGEAAVMFNGHWAMKQIKDHNEALVTPAVIENTGYAFPPGVPFVGSTHLLVWRHSPHDQEAVQMINHLTSLDLMASIFTATGNLPARVEAYNRPPFIGDPDYRLVSQCLRQGRGFRSARLWAGVEMRLNALCDKLWDDLFTDPGLNVEAEVEHRVRDLATRLEKTLLANW